MTENLETELSTCSARGIKYALLGIPESIGPRANLGRSGAQDAWVAFLTHFLNLQSNAYVPVAKTLLLGQVDCADLMERAEGLNNTIEDDLRQLKSLCNELDSRVKAICELIFAAGLEPIVIGGGHNNCLPIIQALNQVSGQKVCAVNLDPHADFRSMEGRHSGNGFRYAHEQGLLSHYHVIGLNPHKNNAAILKAMSDAGYGFDTYNDIMVRRDPPLPDACRLAAEKIQETGLPAGIELDMDSLAGMPASAYTTWGMSLNDAEIFVQTLAMEESVRYLHLCEAAPSLHPNGNAHGDLVVGQALTALVVAYLSGRENR